MTLDTRIYVTSEVDAHEVFRFCQGLIGSKEAKVSDKQDRDWSHGEQYVNPANPWTIANDPGQGFPAWLMLYYRPSGALRTEQQAAEHDPDFCNIAESKYFDPDLPVCAGAGSGHDPACWVEVSFDTSYGYKGNGGEGCGDLHARLVAELGQWLAARGATWRWRNEFSGEVHDGYDNLIDLMSGGFEASAWYRASALPAILSGVAEQ